MFSRKLLLPLGAVLLSGLTGAASSSGADDVLFVRAQGEIERLWSGVLGCAESSSSFAIRNRFDDFESTYGESVPAGGSSDYSECGKRALRNTGSRILVDTIEDALRQGGLALFEEGFQLDSSLSWVSEESSDGTIKGEIDAVIPFWNKDGHVIFTQPGLIFWKGLEEEDRVDGNFGVVYRTNLENTPIGIDAIGGASLFYDWDFHRVGHSRLGIGADIQSGFLHGAFNYYHPLSGERDGQREGFIEEALRGMDARLAFERDTVRAGARLGYWRYDGGEDVTDEWKASIGFDAGFRIVPGVFIEGEWEKHQEDVILDQRLSLGLAFRFSLPDFEGQSYGNGGMPMSLYKIVEREKRILYEEREDVPRIRLTLQSGSQGGSSVAEGDTLIISGELVELTVPVMLDFVIGEDASSAELGSDKDFTYGYKVYEPDAGTGGQSAPDDATNCPNATCEMTIPAGITKFDIEMDILEDSDDKEVPEEIVLRVDVPEEYQRMLQGAEATVTIRAHGNSIGFAADAVAMLAEDNETEGIVVSVSIDRPSPTPITLDIATSGTATAGRDYRISGTSLVIPANASSASLRLHGINNDEDEGNKSIVLTLSGNLPEGWAIIDDEHEVTLLDDDHGAGFSARTGRADEPKGAGNSSSYTAMVVLTHTPAENVNLTIASDDSTASSDDYSLSTTMVSFASGATEDDLAKPVTITINPDSASEPNETVVLTLMDQSGSLQNGGNDFKMTRSTFTLTIPSNDNVVQFSEVTGQGNLGEADGTRTRNLRISIANNSLPENTNINIKRGGTATEGEDYNITVTSPVTASYASGVLTIPANEGQIDLAVTVIDDPADDFTNEMIELTLEDADGNLPLGWAIDTSKSTENLTIIDNDRGVSFNSNKITETREEPNAVFLRANINFSSLLTESVTIPLTITGDRDAFEIDAFDRQSIALQNDMVTVPSNVNSISLRIKPIEDPDDRDDLITVTIEKDKLPPNYGVGTDNVWEVNIIDNDKRTVSFVGSSSPVSEDGGSATVKLEIWPPLEENVSIPLTITGGDGDYSLDATAPASASVSNNMVNFIQSEDSGSVTLSLTAMPDDDSFDDIISLTIDEANLPADYQASRTKNIWTLHIVDGDKRVVSFADASTSVREGETVSTQIELSEALTENVAIPLMISGDGAYSISASAPGSATFSNSTVHFVQSEDDDSVTLQFEAGEDLNNRDEIVTVSIDTSNLPAGYEVDENKDTWTINITDDDTRAVSLRHSHTGNLERVRVNEGNAWNLTEVHISPPLEAGQNAVIPLKITGDSDAYWLTRSAPHGAGIEQGHAPQGTGIEQNTRVYFAQNEDADSVALFFRARRDIDFDEDRVTVAIDGDNLPDGFYLGQNSVWNVRIVDNRTPVVYFAVPFYTRRFTPGEVHVDPPSPNDIASIIDIRVRSSPGGPAIHVRNGKSNFFSSAPYDHNDGTGGRVDIRSYNDGDCDMSTWRVSNHEINIRCKPTKSGNYSFWIHSVPSGAFIGDPSRVNLRIQ
ncbi:MAG: inverse autotransporter beta domain-containing protein [Hyphomicrobiales bacterium]|nr:inverse autotransporter beta domain-containing protein [Hyphomicrobiales bacterium]